MVGKLITLPLRVSFASARLFTRAATGAAGRALSLAGHTVGVVTPGRSGQQRPPAGEEPAREPREFQAPERERADAQDPERERRDVESRAQDAEAPAQAQNGEAPVRAQDAEARVQADPRAQPPGRPRVEEPPSPSVPPIPPAPPSREPEPAMWEAPVEEEPTHVSEEPELVREEAEPGAEDGAGASITVMEPWNGYARMSARDVIARASSANPAELAAVRLYESRHRSRQTVLAAVDRQLKLANGGQTA